MGNKIIDLKEVARYPHKLDKLITDHARKMNELIRLAFKAMHAEAPSTSLWGWRKDTDGNVYLSKNGERADIRLVAASDKELEGIPCLGGI